LAWDLAKVKKALFTPEQFFKTVDELEELHGLKVLCWGDYGVGKSYLGLSMPTPLYCIDTEFGCAKVARGNFRNKLKEINIFECRVINEETGEADFVQSLAQIEQALTSLKDVQTGSVLIDSISDIYTFLNAWVLKSAPKRVSDKSGREFVERLAWQERNEKYYLMIMRLLASPLNVCATAKEVPLYGVRGEELSGKGPRWMDMTPYWFDAVVHIVKSEGDKYFGIVEKLRHKRVVNAKIQDVTFEKLCWEIYRQTGLKVKGVAYN